MYFKSLVTLLFLSFSSLFADTIGDASWYGEKFQGKPTASGEPFDMYAYTTAHRTLPFGTILIVTNLSNQKSVEVRVNDRGPVKKNRIVDLSYQAAKVIGIIEEGVGEVSIMLKDKEETSSKKNILSKVSSSNPYLTDEEERMVTEKMVKSIECEEYVQKTIQKQQLPREEKEETIKIQIAAFTSEVNAQNFINREKEREFKMQLLEVYSESSEQTLYKVVIVCNSSSMAKKIMALDEYSGAYLFHR